MIGPFRFTITFLSSIFTLAALVLTIFAICAPAGNHSAALTSVHFIRFDLSNFTIAPILSDAGVSQLIISAAKTANFSASDFGFSNTYVFTPWGYCQSDKTGPKVRFENCTSPEAMYALDPVQFFQSQLSMNRYSSIVTSLIGTSSSLTVTLPLDVQNYVSIIDTVSKLIFVCGFISIGLLGIQFFLNFVSCVSKVSSVFSFILSLLSFIAVILTAGASTGMYSIIRSKFDEYLSDTGIKAILDPTYYGLIWGATAAALLSTLGWMFSICCGSTK